MFERVPAIAVASREARAKPSKKDIAAATPERRRARIMDTAIRPSSCCRYCRRRDGVCVELRSWR